MMKAKTIHRLILIFLALPLVAKDATAQSFYSIRRERSLLFTGGAGSANYFGELTNPRSLGEVKPGLNVGLEHYFFGRFSARLEAAWFQISGDDAKADDGIDERMARNLSFVSNNIELSTTATVHLFSLGKRYYQRPAINFYGFVGIGVAYINPKTEYNGEMIALQPLRTEGIAYSRFQPVVPFGGGVKFKMGPFFNVAFEGGLRKTFTDYLDDVSIKRYPDPATLSSDLARALSNRATGTALVRGNPETDDWYFMMSARIQYYLPVDFISPRSKLYTKKRKAYNRRRR
jgi:hypothetical protein